MQARDSKGYGRPLGGRADLRVGSPSSAEGFLLGG